MQRSLQAQVRDPLWMLARQWQVGEFLGEDAGSPIHTTLGVEMRTATTYRPGTDDTKTVAIDHALPIEVHVEREKAALQLRGSVQAGLRFEALVRGGGVANPETVIAAFRVAFPIAKSVPDQAYSPPDAQLYRAVTAGRVTDGEALYTSAKAAAAGQVPPKPLPAEAATAGMNSVLAAFLAYRDSLFSEPAHDAAWQPRQLSYSFGLGSPAPGENLVLNAPEFQGGHLDWYSFSLATAQTNPAATSEPGTEITPTSFDFMPIHVVFRGMPDSRWWNFEDAVTDFGQLDTEHVDLAKLLVMEFALVYGNDWFWTPVPVNIGISGSGTDPRGTLSRVTTLVVTDTFGIRTLIRPSEQTAVTPDESPWSMYKISADGARSDFILMAPTLGVVEDGDALEQVRFLRDDMAALAWAVEYQLQGDLDCAVDGYQSYLQRIEALTPTEPPKATPGGPKIFYTLETPVPDNWIPMVPVKSAQGELLLRRGTIELSQGKARAVILEPEHPFYVADRVVSRAGNQVDRYFRYTRSTDGTIFLWMARKSGAGRGEGWSGLRFDVVRDLAQP